MNENDASPNAGSPAPAAPRRRFRWGRALVLPVLVLAIALAGLRAAAPALAERWITALLARQLNIELDIDDIELDLLSGRATVKGVWASLDGEFLCSAHRAHVATDDAVDLVMGRAGSVQIRFEQFLGEFHMIEDGLNLARIGPRVPDDGSPPGPRILLDLAVDDGAFRYSDQVTDPVRPLSLVLDHASVAVRRLLVGGEANGAPLMDVSMLGTVYQDETPAIVSGGFWRGEDDDGVYMELHVALTAFDVRTIPQYVRPDAKSILGGPIVHTSATAVAHESVIEYGLIDLDVEGASTNLQLRFAGPLREPAFDADSPLMQAFRLGYLRAVDSGSSVFTSGKSFGTSLWDRSSGLVTETAGGVGSAVTEGSIADIPVGLWKGLKGLFVSEDGSEDEERKERLARLNDYVQRQLAFRKLYLERRLEVARKREPERVNEFALLLANPAEWNADVDQLVPGAELRSAAEADSDPD